MKGNLGLHDALPQPEFPDVPKGQIWVNEKLSRRRMKQIVKHEKFENYMMKEKNMKYKDAHKIAEEWEKY
jgi:hypothetical protein